MKLFLSYPSGQRELAERLTLALEAEGHEAFIDRGELKAGESFHQRLREAILGAEAMVFLVTPDSVRPGSYALAELNIAQQRWRRPGGHVLPVIVSPTPITDLPPYLTAVTVLEPRGDAVAEIVAAVARLDPPSRSRRKWLVGGAAALATVVAGSFLVNRQAELAAAETARRAVEQRDLAQAVSARELCFTGGYAVALTQLNELAARGPVQDAVLDAREDCAMRWLRDMRSVPGKQTFSEQVAMAQPLLLQGMARAGTNERKADLRAHIGWGEFLRSRDGIGGVDPVPHWKRALADDPDNVYAHAMWARQLLDRSGRFNEARTHFASAVASGRNNAFVRALQFNTLLVGPNENPSYAVTVADEMRRAKETIRSDHRDRFWSNAFGYRMLDADARGAVLSSLPPADLLATFIWLFPGAEVSAERHPLWRFNVATLQANKGDTAAARMGLQSLLAELEANGQAGRLLDETRRSLAQSGSAAPVKNEVVKRLAR
jgi:TIR domain